MTPQQKIFAALRQKNLKIDDKERRELALIWLEINRKYALAMEALDITTPVMADTVITEVVTSVAAQIGTLALKMNQCSGVDVVLMIEQTMRLVHSQIEELFNREMAEMEGKPDAKDSLH